MKRFFTLALILLLGSSYALGQEFKLINYPVEAIADSAELSKREFKKRYPGIDLSQIGLIDEGWYVRYQHELLVLVYGPIEDLDFARRQKALMEEIRLALVLKDPKLSSSKVDLIEFRFGAPTANSQAQ